MGLSVWSVGQEPALNGAMGLAGTDGTGASGPRPRGSMKGPKRCLGGE